MNRTTIHTAVFLACWAIWTVALLMPDPKESATKVLGDEGRKFIVGKALHVCAYAFLAVLGGSIMLARPQRWLLLGGLSLHAFATEYLQQFVGRGASWRDVGLDHLGIAMGVAIGWRWWRVLLPRPTETAL